MSMITAASTPAQSCIEANIRRMLDMSTAHVSADALDWLAHQLPHYTYDHGQFLPVSRLMFRLDDGPGRLGRFRADVPECIQQLITVALDHDVSMIRLDADSDTCPGLPVFDW